MKFCKPVILYSVLSLIPIIKDMLLQRYYRMFIDIIQFLCFAYLLNDFCKCNSLSTFSWIFILLNCMLF